MYDREYSKLEETFECIKNNGFSSLTPPKHRIPANYYRQMECLKGNGVQIGDEQACLRTLRDITYYRLKGYVWLFKREGLGVKFETLLDIHEFDSKMRVILLRALSTIEIHLRAQFSYFFSFKYGAYGYLDAANYSLEKKKPKQGDNDSSKNEDMPVHNHPKFLNSLKKSIGENMDLAFVRHYVENHDGVMPFWVMSELMGFGQWFYFYKGMKGADREEFLKRLFEGKHPVQPETLKAIFSPWHFLNWLGCCKTLRNVCAHGGRLYGVKFLWNPKILWISNTSKTRERAAELNKRYLHQTLFGSLIAVMLLYPDAEEWKTKILRNIKSLLKEYCAKGIDKGCLGFPPDWEIWLEKP